MTSISPSPFRSGYISIVGWPNSGKSTLLNAILGTKLSIVSPRPQTTREAILGILNEKDLQMVFVDTPGWLKPSDPFQSSMKKAIVRSIYDDADVIVWLLEPKKIAPEDEELARKLYDSQKPLCLAINKMDTSPAGELIDGVINKLMPILGEGILFHRVSAKSGLGLNELKADVISKLPMAPPYFPIDQITDRWERFYVTELIREQIFRRYQEEVPHASTVLIEEFKEIPGRKDLIKVIVYVETEGQMKIMVGEKGRAIKELGQASRQEIEVRLGRPVFLELVVKVRKNWRKDEAFIKSLKEKNL